MRHIDKFIQNPDPEVVRITGQRLTLEGLKNRKRVFRYRQTTTHEAMIEALAGIDLVENQFYPIGVLGAYDKQKNLVELYSL